MQRRALMPIKFAQVYLLDLSAAGAKDIEKIEFGGMATPTIGDQPGQILKAGLMPVTVGVFVGMMGPARSPALAICLKCL